MEPPKTRIYIERNGAAVLFEDLPEEEQNQAARRLLFRFLAGLGYEPEEEEPGPDRLP